jgi:invasion protein IalB
MKDTVAGAVLAIVFLALLFAAPRMLPRGIEGVTHAEISQISPGFSGTKILGSWTLQCSAVPKGHSGSAAATSPGGLGRCRMARGYHDTSGRLVLAIVFEYAGPAKMLTMVVHFPPVGGKGQYLVVVLNPSSSLKLPVFGCNKASCVAVGELIPAAQSLLTAAPKANIVLPPLTNGKHITIGIRLDGLGQALDGMHRAEL